MVKALVFGAGIVGSSPAFPDIEQLHFFGVAFFFSQSIYIFPYINYSETAPW